MRSVSAVEEKYIAAARIHMTPERFEHACAVAASAAELAQRHGESSAEAELAGLLHDYARDLDRSELLRIAEAKGLIRYEIERQVPVLLHAPVGAALASELGVDNPRVLRVIEVHTAGAPGMDQLAKIVYLADLIAAGRSCPIVGKLRIAVKDDLDAAMRIALAFGIRHMLKRGKLIHPQTVAAWNFYVEQT